MPVIDLAADARMSPIGVVSADRHCVLSAISSEVQWPVQLQLGGLLDRRLFFCRPMQVSLYKDQDVYVARSSEVDQFGYGSDAAEALDDLGKTLSEMYFYLAHAEESSTLGESLGVQFALIREFIGVRGRQFEAA
jgi:hypothetical protein